jgi:hypothetical protein
MDLGHPQAHVLDGADHVRREADTGDADEVPISVLTLGDDEEPRKQVLDQALGPETERDTHDGGRRHETRDGHPEAVEDLHPGDDVDNDQGSPREHLS